MEHRDQAAITLYLQEWQQEGSGALDRFLPLVIGELRDIAANQLKRERGNHTLQPTALVNECYLRLQASAPAACRDRTHFFALATRVMRRILVDHARGYQAEKRWHQAIMVTGPSEDLSQPQTQPPVDLIALDTALQKLQQIDSRQVKVVELRFFGGLSLKEIATCLGVTERTAKRKWAAARLWLYHQMAS